MATAVMTSPAWQEPAGELRSGAELELPDGGVLLWLVPPRVTAHWLSRPAVWALPGAPPELRGVTYWRGKLAPVFEAARWLDPSHPAHEPDQVLLLSLPAGPAALLVRGAPQLVEVPTNEAASAAPVAPPALQAFLSPRLTADGRVVHEFAVEPWLLRVRASPAPRVAPSAEESA